MVICDLIVNVCHNGQYMTSPVKQVQIRIRLAPEDNALLEGLAGTVLSVTDVASYLLHAAIDCAKKNKGKLQFPPAFTLANVDDHELILNERRLPLITDKPLTEAQQIAKGAGEKYEQKRTRK